MLDKIIKSLIVTTLILVVILFFDVFNLTTKEKSNNVIEDSSKIDTVRVDSIAK